MIQPALRKDDAMKPCKLLVGLGLFLLTFTSIAFCGLAQAQPRLDAQAIANAAGTATTEKNGVIRIEWPRKDVTVKVDGMTLKPAAGLGSWAAFTAAQQGAMMMG